MNGGTVPPRTIHPGQFTQDNEPQDNEPQDGSRRESTTSIQYVNTPAPKKRSLRRKRPEVAFVLSGGGNLGAIQVGQLRALHEEGIRPDLIVGCSVGALNGGAIAVDATGVGLDRLERIWCELEATPENLMPESWMPNPVQLIRKGESLHSNQGLQNSILHFLDGRQHFEELAVPFQCVATDIDAAKEKWFDQGALLPAILASSALPSVYPLVTIDGHRYLDGGILNNVPIQRAVDLGAKRIYVCHVGHHGRPNPTVKRPIDAALIAYWVARNSRFARDLSTVPRSVEAIVLPPGTRPGVKFDDFSQSRTLIEQGYFNAKAYLAELQSAEEAGESLPERLASDARRAIDELRERWSDRRALTERSSHQPENPEFISDTEAEEMLAILENEAEEER